VRCHQIFEQSGIPHSVRGGVAVCLHGYQRNLTDVDMIINARDSALVKQLLLAEAFQWDDERKGVYKFQWHPSAISVLICTQTEGGLETRRIALPRTNVDSTRDRRISS